MEETVILAKETASNAEAEVAFNKTPVSAVKRVLKAKSVEIWEAGWKIATKGEITKSFFP